MAKKKVTMDGNMVAAHVSYAFTEAAGIYPITPSSDMAQHVDEWAAQGRKNIFGETVKVVEMQSEGGAAGVVHGSLQAGALTTTYTASQGLLLMIPNMYKISGENLPGVFHVSARTVATHALSIFGEHSDVYAARATGCAMLAAGSVQEVNDMAAVAHLAAIKGKLPFVHFFDGFRTSHELQKVEIWDYEDLKSMADMNAIQEFKESALRPDRPVTRGTAQNPDVYFQSREACNHFYANLPAIVESYMAEVGKRTGRKYNLFDYYGAPDADRVIIAMGSVTETTREVIDFLAKKGEKVGLVAVHLFRPFSTKHFLNALPKSVKKIAVLDRSKECGAGGEPLYMDIREALYGTPNAPVVVGGRYGLSSKDTTPAQILAVYKNLSQPEPKNGFTIGIVDDVTFTSLPLESDVDTVAAGTVECKFFGLGSDGTVGANKNSIKIIGDYTDMYAQGYFAYDSKKSGGNTVSHLRFGKDPIRATYFVNHPDFVSCSVPPFIEKYDMLRGIKKGGTFLLNTFHSESEIGKYLPDFVKKQLAEKEVNFYIINATQVAEDLGLGNRTNTIMQSAFFKLSKVIEYDKAVKFMKDAVEKSYGKKGAHIVKMNNDAIDQGATKLIQVKVDPSWKNLNVSARKFTAYGTEDCKDKELIDFVNNVAMPMNLLEGDSLPVSAFAKRADGTIPAGSSAYEKRGIAVNVPEWQCDNCIQCNQCAYVCPHGVIRPFLLNADEKKNAPSAMVTKKAIGKEAEGLEYRIQVSTLDCTGCGSCADVCPAKTKALVMKPLEGQLDNMKNWDYLHNKVGYKDTIFKKNNVKGLQFARPYFEFSGACAGCGETPYIKAITQLFGDRMMVANATGCSSIYGGSSPASPYCKDPSGRGPVWANSLFEDNAEYGMGMAVAVNKMRDRVAKMITENLSTLSAESQKAGREWLESKEDGEKTRAICTSLISALKKDNSAPAKELLKYEQYFEKRSVWIIGGDGWAYDIGYGGLDHVLASGEKVNILVLDTEVYSNTGGQASKASQTASVAKFAASGKKTRKKDLGKMAMSYGYVYVAQVAMGANQGQYLKALQEAESYPGPAIIIAYAPCIAHGITNGGMTKSQMEEKLAVESGYWHLYRYNPLLENQNQNPFVLDSKEPDFNKYAEFIKSEIRFSTLMKEFPEQAEVLFKQALEDAKWRYMSYKRLTEMKY